MKIFVSLAVVLFAVALVKVRSVECGRQPCKLYTKL